jgi:hypothetical protein
VNKVKRSLKIVIALGLIGALTFLIYNIDTKLVFKQAFSSHLVSSYINFQEIILDEPNQCGDSIGSRRQLTSKITFLPVYVKYSYDNLVRSRFICRDAKMVKQNGEEVIRIASFTDIGRATDFSWRIQPLFSSDQVKVGEPRTIKFPEYELISEKVEFAAGTSDITLNGQVFANDRKRYKLTCWKGQKFSMTVLEGNVEVVLGFFDEELLGKISKSNTSWKGVLPENGDYIVEVSAPSKTSYSLRIEVL